MGAMLSKLWTDPTYFATAIRTVLAAISMAAQQGVIPGGKVGWWLGMIGLIGSFAIPAGQKNDPATVLYPPGQQPPPPQV